MTAQLLPVARIEIACLLLIRHCPCCYGHAFLLPLSQFARDAFFQRLDRLLRGSPEEGVRTGLALKTVDAAIGILARAALISFNVRNTQHGGLHKLDKMLAWLRGGDQVISSIGQIAIFIPAAPFQMRYTFPRQSGQQRVYIGRAFVVAFAVARAIAQDERIAGAGYADVEQARLSAFVRCLTLAALWKHAFRGRGRIGLPPDGETLLHQ